MKIVGLTGNIASGKSAVTQTLRRWGVYVVDADEVAREIVRAGSEGAGKIREAFGDGVFDEQGNLDRKALGTLIFSSEQARRKLDLLTHPLIWEGILSRLRQYARQHPGAPLAVIDAALLIESGGLCHVDALWLVVCDDGVRQQRLMSRDGLTREQALQCMCSQRSQEEKRAYADAVIDNSGEWEKTLESLRALLVPFGFSEWEMGKDENKD